MRGLPFDLAGKCSVHHQHRYNGCLDHRLGNASEYPFAKTCVPVRPHDDQIGRGINCMLVENLVDSAPSARKPIDGHFDAVASEVGGDIGTRFVAAFG
ncbi:hypothetical protein ABIE78_000573 [Sinorhizobium fredii]